MDREKTILTRVSDEEHDAVKDLSKKEQWSMSKVVQNAVVFYLKARGYLKEEK